eukprot:10968754-Alexandrium_andersonii.AAC.1
MSASLVGSEMCIRDRPWTLWFTSLSSPGVARASTVVSGRTLRARLLGAVSYTHLTLPTICSV